MKWYLFLILGVCCISSSAILVTVAGASPTTAAFYRNFFAALIWLVLFPVSTPFKKVMLTGRQDFIITSHFLRLFAEKCGVVGVLIGLGLTFAIDLWAWHRCIFLVGAGAATLLGNVQVVFIAFFSACAFGEKLQRHYWAGSGLALVGIGLLTLTRGIGDEVVLGLILGLLTAFTYAIFLVFLKLLGLFDIGPEQTLLWVAMITLFFITVPLYLEGQLLPIPDLSTLGWLLLHAFISSVVGWWLIVKALHYLPVAQTSTILLLQPLLTSLWGDLFLGQHLAIIQIAGIVVALAGIRLANWR
jgi:drug/metabolite transporter (DMT)-like permease